MADITIKISKRELDKYIKEAGDTIIQKAVPRAINRALTSTRTFADRFIRETVSIKSKDLKKAIEVVNATKKTQQGEISFFFERIPLSRFAPRQKIIQTPKGKRKGVTVDIKGARKFVKGGFLATVGAGHVGVFKRKGERRLPIKELTTNVLRSLFKEDAQFLNKVREYAEESFAKELDSNIRFYLEKEKGE